MPPAYPGQTTQPPSCGGGSISCPGMNGGSYCFYGTTCPSLTTPPYPGGNYPGQMPPVPSCPSGQYTCNNVCVPNGSSCNNYPYYQPGTANPSCGGASYFCPSKNQCVPQGENCPPPGNNQNQQPSQQFPAPGMPNQPTRPYPQPQTQTGNQAQNPGLQPPLAGKFGPESMGKPEFGGEQGEDMGPKMDEQRFQQMKRGMSQFGNGIKQMQKMVARLEKQLGGTVGIPPELKAALAKAPEVLALIKNAKSAEELEEAMNDVQDIGETMQDWGPRLGDLMRLQQMLKQGERELRNLQRSVSRAQTYAKRNAAVADAAAELKSMYDEAAAALAEAKALAKTDAEGALDKIENGFYGNMEEFWNKVAFVDMAQNLSRGITKANSDLRRAEQAITKLQKKLGVEKTAELKAMVAELKAKVAEVKKLGSQRPVDIEAFQAAGEELWDQFVELQNRLAELGVSFYVPTIQSQAGVKFELPQGYGSMPGPAPDGGFGQAPDTMPGQAPPQPQASTTIPAPGF